MKYVFVGNRKFVLQKMLTLGLKIEKIFIVENSYLAKDIKNMNCHSNVCIINNKQQFLTELTETNYDILVSNGCPFILPKVILYDERKYINIHPSYLPNLRGIDPVIGAILHKLDAGATCHHMNEMIDAGDIISQIKIPFSEDLDTRLLYQLTFIAEQQVFLTAYENDFQRQKVQIISKNDIYYNRKYEDMLITFQESAEEIVSKINAFNNISQGAFFQYKGNRYKVYSAKILNNPYLINLTKGLQHSQIFLCYENCIIVNLTSGLLLLDCVVGDLSKIKVGMLLGAFENAECC